MLDDGLVEAHFLQRFIRVGFEWDWIGAGKAFDQFLTQIPNTVEVAYNFVLYFLFAGRYEDAVALVHRVIAQDPLALFPKHLLGFTQFFTHRLDEAFDTFQEVLEMEPGHFMGHMFLGSIYECKKQYEQALACYQKVLDLYGREPLILDHMGRLYGLWGKRDEAQKFVEELQALSRERHVAPAHFVYTSIALGDREEALAHLERAYEERDPILPLFFMWPWPQIDAFREEPRVQAVLQKMGLAQ